MATEAQPPTGQSVRFKLAPRLVPLSKAARYLHMTSGEFRNALPALVERGFPSACPVIGNFDLTAIDRWIDRQSTSPNLAPTESGQQDIERAILERITKCGRPKS